MCPIQSLVEQPPEVLGFAQFDQSTERSVRVGGSGVDEEASLILVAVDLGVNPLANAGGIVTALERQFPDQHVRERVEHHISCARIALIRIQISLMAPPAMPRAQRASSDLTASLFAHDFRASELKRMKMPSPWTWVAGTQSGAERPSGARGAAASPVPSSGDSTRVNPSSAFTSRSRSRSSARVIVASKPGGTPTFLLMKCG